MDGPTFEGKKATRIPLSRTPSYLNSAVPRRAIRSFENLVALANDQERLRDARKMVWRDRGEPAVELSTIRQCLEHALRGGSRTYSGNIPGCNLSLLIGAGVLAFGIRSGFNIFVLLFRLLRLPRFVATQQFAHGGVHSLQKIPIIPYSPCHPRRRLFPICRDDRYVMLDQRVG